MEQGEATQVQSRLTVWWMLGGTSSGNKDCFNCGREDHFSRDRRCPARGTKCDQRLDISTSSVVRISLRIPIRSKLSGKEKVGVIGETDI